LLAKDTANSCALREECGGLFQSALKRHSAYIKPFLASESIPMIKHEASVVPTNIYVESD